MIPYWIKFLNRDPVCIEASSAEDARAEAKPLGVVDEIRRLPYPANPNHSKSPTINLCYSPEECKGRSSCPKGYACSE